MHILIDLCWGMRHARLGIAVVGGITACSTLLGMLLSKLQHFVQAASELPRMRSLL